MPRQNNAPQRSKISQKNRFVGLASNTGGYQSGGNGGNRRGGLAFSNSTGNFTSNNNYKGGHGSYGNSELAPEEWTTPTLRDLTVESTLFKKPETRISFDHYEDIAIEVSGRDAPEPIQASFAEIDLHRVVCKNLEPAEYSRPIPVQRYAVPVVISGRDLMACAQTGSGKTAAFLAPILSQMFSNGPPSSAAPRGTYSRGMQYPTAIVLAPTRELAIQIHEESLKLSYRSRVLTVVLYEGADIGQQTRDLVKGCHMIVATPGRLKDMVERGKVSLEHVKYLVLDEAGRMLDMGFEPQIRHLVEEINMPKPPMRQTLMFSATFPKEIQILAKDILHDCAFLTVGKVGSTCENITQHAMWKPEEQKVGDDRLDVLNATSNIKKTPAKIKPTDGSKTSNAACDKENCAHAHPQSIERPRTEPRVTSRTPRRIQMSSTSSRSGRMAATLKEESTNSPSAISSVNGLQLDENVERGSSSKGTDQASHTMASVNKTKTPAALASLKSPRVLIPSGKGKSAFKKMVNLNPAKRTVKWYEQVLDTVSLPASDAGCPLFPQLHDVDDLKGLPEVDWSDMDKVTIAPVKHKDTTKTFRMSLHVAPKRRLSKLYIPSNARGASNRLNFEGFLENERKSKLKRPVKEWGGHAKQKPSQGLSVGVKKTDFPTMPKVTEDDDWISEHEDEENWLSHR